MSIAIIIVLSVFAGFVVILTVKGIRIVPEQSVMMIERLGKFHRQLHPGLNIIIPVIGSPRGVLWRHTHKQQGEKIHIRMRATIKKAN